MDATRLGRIFAESIGNCAPRAHNERWAVRDMALPAKLPMSTLGNIFADKVIRLYDEYLTLRPSMNTLITAMTRHRTVH